MSAQTITVPLPGTAHPAFSPEFVSQVLTSQVNQSDKLVRVMNRQTGLVEEFRPAGIRLPYDYVVWLDEHGRGIAQVEGNFSNLPDGALLAHPVFADAHVELPLR